MFELLVVLVIIAILSFLFTISFRGVTSSTDMTRSSDDIAKAVILASQRAATFNRQTSIRFLSQSANGSYVAYQLWEQADSANQNSWQPVEPIRLLPQDIVITSSGSFSTFLTRANITGSMTASTGTVWNYAQVYFAPDGSLVASTGQTSITLIGANTSGATSGLISGLPPNFAVVDIEPLHAIPIVYRPQ